ncbi:unnamed protein product [Aphis gossypii]|uniref:Uncharacterized protein n=1 Tax=Aphis gossypii TaxID=80765 RepID=A0A9P0J1Y1_APHGO|nr:unnamed protein product [Aphis gossypii]
MLSGLSFAQSLRLWSESKSMTIGFQTTHRPQAVTDPSTANTLYTQVGISYSCRNRTETLAAKILSAARRSRRSEDTMILMRILRFNDHGRGTLDGRGADWEVVTGGLGDRGSRRHGCLLPIVIDAMTTKKTIPANGRRNQCAGGDDQRAENDDETRFMTRQM